ncbi:hypothetical protein [Halosolutus gelatinilyticus]|uniref:hypothetical protein n=1 Tax=Halosolutus gelatinilyticus TaxID=2931975 RepID=UPI001FF1998D|nr:hypothetical protein [Halosolutus gelatinilyticus]
MERPDTDRRSSVTETQLPNVITVEGQGTPASFEITVDGAIEMDGAVASEEATIVSGTTAEGTVEADVQRFRFSGELRDVTIVNRGGLGSEGVVDPEIYVES